jgi:hypothetical protein
MECIKSLLKYETGSDPDIYYALIRNLGRYRNQTVSSFKNQSTSVLQKVLINTSTFESRMNRIEYDFSTLIIHLGGNKPTD